MGANGKMRNRKSTCLYLDMKVVEIARQLGLNISKVSENALIEAIDRLTEPKHETALTSPARADIIILSANLFEMSTGQS
jgi:post-segregation antitoxin (ccd killing protein)